METVGSRISQKDEWPLGRPLRGGRTGEDWVTQVFVGSGLRLVPLSGGISEVRVLWVLIGLDGASIEGRRAIHSPVGSGGRRKLSREGGGTWVNHGFPHD